MDEAILSSLYVSFDTVSGAYSSIQEFTNDDVCIRAMKRSFTQKGFELEWCKDFAIYKLGDRCLNAHNHQFFYMYPEEKLVKSGSDIYEEILIDKKENIAKVDES